MVALLLAALTANASVPKIVFIGDSITFYWRERGRAFERRSRLNKGVSGQTTGEMLARFDRDVLSLRPCAVHIMGGINDIAGVKGVISLAQTEANIAEMVRRAKMARVKVVLAAVPPVGPLTWSPNAHWTKPIQQLNAWMRSFAAQQRIAFVRYDTVLDDGSGATAPGLSVDGLHPSPAGYAKMEPLTDAALKMCER